MLIHHYFSTLARALARAAFVIQHLGNRRFPHAAQVRDVFGGQPTLRPIVPQRVIQLFEPNFACTLSGG